MKILLLTIMCFSVFVLPSQKQCQFYEILGQEKDVTYSVVLIGNDKYNFKNATCVKNGSTDIFTCSVAEVDKLKFQKEDCFGETLSFYGNDKKFVEVVEKLNLKNIKQETFSDIVCVYGYTQQFEEKRVLRIDGSKINVQIVLHGEKIFIGTPVVVGSY